MGGRYVRASHQLFSSFGRSWTQTSACVSSSQTQQLLGCPEYRDKSGPSTIRGKWRLTAVCNIPAFQAAVYSRLSATLSSGQIAANRDHFTSTHVLSLACKSSLFVPITATGLFSAMFLASSRAAFKTSCLPPSTTFDTNPRSFASAAEKGRVEYASSWTRDWFPVTFGRRARVPMSAASPISAS